METTLSTTLSVTAITYDDIKSRTKNFQFLETVKMQHGCHLLNSYLRRKGTYVEAVA